MVEPLRSRYTGTMKHLLLTCCLLAPLSAAETWTFPNPGTGEPLLDLRSELNVADASERGWLQLSDDGNDIVDAEGRRVRFWSVSTGLDNKQLEAQSAWLASLGINLVRIAGHTINPRGKRSAIDEVREEAIEGVWRMVAAHKRNGIACMLTPYWVAKGSDVTNWGIEGYTGKKGIWGKLFFDERLQAAYRGWMKQQLLAVNPHTGIPLAEDPALAVILLQNEDSLLFWTAARFPEPAQRHIETLFHDWCVERYGSATAALEAWSGAAVKSDALAEGRLGFYHIYDATQPQRGGKALRVADQVRFLAETMRAFNEATTRWLREEIGYRGLIIAENWKTADQERLLDGERWSYAACDIIAKNHYFGPIHHGKRAGYMIEKGDHLQHRTVLHNPTRLPAHMKQLRGHPHMVTEASWVNPNRFQSEGSVLTAAFMCLSGLDGYNWFVAGAPWKSLGGHRKWNKWTISQPMLAGQLPAGALILRKGLLRQAEPVVVEHRLLADALGVQPAAITEGESFDPNRDEGATDQAAGGDIDPLAFAQGPVELVLHEEEAPSNVVRTAAREDGRVRSATGEIDWHYQQGVVRIDAPQAQAAIGFLATAGSQDLSTVTIDCHNDYASIVLVALDDRPLAESRRVLLQIGTEARPTGWQTQPARFTPKKAKQKIDGERIVSVGGPPWQVVPSAGRITIANPHLRRARLLGSDFRLLRELPGSQDGGFAMDLPGDGLHVLIDAGE